ncbi:hypothetical protein ACK3TF_000785 [Chlorella vulgaris]
MAGGLDCTSLHTLSASFQSQQSACSAFRHLDMFSRAMLRSLMPAEEVPTDGTYEEPYPLLKLKAPVVTGTALRIMVAISESPLGGPVRTQLLRNNQVLQASQIDCNIVKTSDVAPTATR